MQPVARSWGEEMWTGRPCPLDKRLGKFAAEVGILIAALLS